MTKLQKLYELIKDLTLGLFTGKVIIHFNKGSIAKLEKKETIRIK